MKLTPTAQKLKEFREAEDEGIFDDDPDEAYERRGQAVNRLATCMGSESFGYALWDGGYLKPEQWVEGKDLEKLKKAIKLVGEFKELVESLHDEF